MTLQRPTTPAALRAFVPQHRNFIGVDSDGCIFDTMEIKQKQCFHGAIVTQWKLEAIAPLVRQTAEFVTLYSRSRGLNRFLALAEIFKRLASRPEVVEAGVRIPELTVLRQMISGQAPLGEPELVRRLDAAGVPELKDLLAWTREVDRRVAVAIQKLPPYRWARRALELAADHSDVMCVSQTPADVVYREWDENDLLQFIHLIAGPETGTKAEHLCWAAGTKYPSDRILMIGDSPGDLAAARAAHACFYPILPGHEEDAWRRFVLEGHARFLDGRFEGTYASSLEAEFLARLPEHPPWG